MAFIDKHKHIPGVVYSLLPLYSVELVDNGSNDIGSIAANQLHEVLSAVGTGGVQSCIGECGSDLPVQLFAVCYDDHTRVTGGPAPLKYTLPA